MKTKNISIFNLIAIFTKSQKVIQNKIAKLAHCEKHFHHDYYCDSEKPFISIH